MRIFLESVSSSAAASAGLFVAPHRFRPLPHRMSSLLRGRASMANKRETQGAGDGRRFDQFDRDRIAEPIGRGIADESAAGLVKAEIFVADDSARG